MRPNTRKILEECIENGVVVGYARAHKHGEHPERHHIQECIEGAIWLEIDERFDFERNLCIEVVEGFDEIEHTRVESYIGRLIEEKLKEQK